MSAGQTKKSSGSEGRPDRNSELMRAMGSATGRYDPEPPDQWRWQLEHGSPRDQLVAWVKSKTIALGHHSPFAIDEHGDALYLDHLAVDRGWTLKTAQNVACQVEAEGRIRLDSQHRRIFLCAEIRRRKNSENGRMKSEDRSSVHGNWPTYVVDFIENLSAEKRERAEAEYAEFWQWHLSLLSDAVAAVREIEAPIEDTILARHGLAKKRIQKRREPSGRYVQLQLITEVPEFVQRELGEESYKPENGSVHSENELVHAENGSASLLCSDKDSEGISVSQSPATPAVAASDRPTDTEPTPTDPAIPAIAAAIPTALCERLGETPTPALLERIRERLQGAPPERLTAKIEKRQWGSRDTLGLLLKFAGEVGDAWKLGERQRAAAAAAAEAREKDRDAEVRQLAQEISDDPQSSESDRALAQEILGTGSDSATATTPPKPTPANHLEIDRGPAPERKKTRTAEGGEDSS